MLFSLFAILIATARYRRLGLEPDGEVTINGLVWAGSNLSAVGTFCDYATDYGYYFTWDDALTACPSGWRLPTLQECSDLVGYTGTTFGTGVADGTYTTTSRDATLKCFKVVPKPAYGDASQTLYFPWPGTNPVGTGPTGTSFVGDEGCYWSSTEQNTFFAYFLRIPTNVAATGSTSNFTKTQAMSVRCVRTP